MSAPVENRTKMPRCPVVILGAGLTGLSAALELTKLGVEFRIFERERVAGGHAVTIEDSGYRFDRTGHLLHLRDPELRSQVLPWIGEHAEIRRRSAVWSHGVYTRYPFQANTFGLPPEVAYECVMGFLKAHSAPPAREPENFEEFCLAHFGEGISKHFMIPYNSRVWGVHPREITSAWCQRFVPLPKLEDVVAGAVGMNDRELGYNTHFVYPTLGIGELPRGMLRKLPAVELGKAPRSIDLTGRRLVFSDESVAFDVLINTAPLPAFLRLLEPLDAALRAAASRLRSTHLYYLDVALSAACKKDLHWVYVPEEKYPFYRVGCYSNFSSRMAPPGCANLYVELVDRDPPELSELGPRVARALTEMGLIDSVSDVAFARLRRIDHAYVIFDHAYFEALEMIRPFLESERLLSTGRYGGWNYSSMEDALLFGRRAARDAAALLG